MPKSLFLLMTLCLFGCVVHTKAQDQPLTARDKKVIKLISNIPEVAESRRYIRKSTNGERNLTTEIEVFPSAQDPEYQLSVCEFNGVFLHSHFRFFVNAKTYAVRYWDVAKDTIMPLKQWQQQVRRQKRKKKS